MSEHEVLRRIDVCRICGASPLKELARHDGIPIAGTYLRESDLGEEDRVYPLTILQCPHCALVQLSEILPAEVYRGYRFSGGATATYRRYLDGVADLLMARHGARGRRILEIGSSDGYLLRALRQRGAASVYGYEPSLAVTPAGEGNDLPVCSSFFSAATLHHCPILPADLVIIRHVLEHIDDLHAFLDAVRAALAPGVDSRLVIEVPDLAAIVEHGLYAHFYHEHLSYFCLVQLDALLAGHGFVIHETNRVNIHGGSLFVVCGRAEGENGATSKGASSVSSVIAPLPEFFARRALYFERLGNFVRAECAAGVRMAGYGAAERTVVTCALSGLDRNHVRYIVDGNSHLHGCLTPGSRIPIYSPSHLDTESPDAVIIFATSYEAEIVAALASSRLQGVRCVSILPAPRYLA